MPAQDLQDSEGFRADAKPVCQLLRHERSADDRDERHDNAERADERQRDRDRVSQDERPGLRDAVRAVDSLDQGSFRPTVLRARLLTGDRLGATR